MYNSQYINLEDIAAKQTAVLQWVEACLGSQPTDTDLMAMAIALEQAAAQLRQKAAHPNT